MYSGCWADTACSCRHSAQEAPSSSSSSRCCCRAAPQTDSSSAPEPSCYPGCSGSRRRRQRQRSTPGRRWRLGCAACARWQSVCGPAAAGRLGCCCCSSRSRSWGSEGPWGAWLDPQCLRSPHAPQQQQSAEAGSAAPGQHQAAPGGNAWSHGPHPSHTNPPAWAAARVSSSSHSSGGCRSSSRRSSRGSSGCQQDTAWGACVP